MIGPHRGANLLARRISAWSRRGVVGAVTTEAANVGRDMLRQGGNAFDAAVAAALCDTVFVPSKCGLAGELVALVKRAGEPLRALIAIGTGPERLDEAVARHGLPTTGGLAVGVPTAHRGYSALATLGTLPLATLAAPAVAYAREGFEWSPLNYYYTRKSLNLLRAENPDGVVYLPDGEPIRPGEWVSFPGLADVIERFVSHRTELFTGALGDQFVETVSQRGGVITREDLRSQKAEWAEPVTRVVAGQRFWATPSPTHGPSLLTALEGGPDHGDLDAQVARFCAARAELKKRSGKVSVGSGTSVITAADGEGNAAVVVHSVSHPTFGSGIVLPGSGLVLSNRPGRGFTADLGHPNAPARGRRPVTTLHAWAMEGNDVHDLTLGATSGGQQQIPWNLQAIEAVRSLGDIAEATLSPLWSFDPATGAITQESSGSNPTKEASTATPVPALSMTSGLQLVQTPDEHGVCHVVSDIRSVGGVAGA